MTYNQQYQQQQYNAGGFQQQARPVANNQGVSPEVQQWFQAVDRDRSGQITALELQQALMNGDGTSFDADTIKMLVTLFDNDRTGQINVQEFSGIYGYIKQWQGIFSAYDKDRSGTMDSNELTGALAQFGYQLGPRTVQLLLEKYAAPASVNRMSRPGVTFDHFIRCCCAVRALTQGFQSVDPQRRGTAQIQYHQFLDLALAAP